VISVRREQAIWFRLARHNLGTRLPAGAYVAAARYALQDSAPRSALLSLHARVSDCEPTAWADPGLVQTYSPRAAVHVLPAADFGMFTVGRLPSDPAARQVIADVAAQACDWLAGRRVRSTEIPGRELGSQLRHSAASGRIALRWDASGVWFWEVPKPELDLSEARKALCRRHLQGYGPSTPTAFAWWAGLPPADGRRAFQELGEELLPVLVEGAPASILAADEQALRSAALTPGVRLLPAEELRLFGADRTGLFVGPGQQGKPSPFDTFHPHGVLRDGRIVAAWGRRGGRVQVRTRAALPAATRDAIAAEVLEFPIPNAAMSVEFGAAG